MSMKDMLICLKRGKLIDIMNYGISRIHYDFFMGGVSADMMTDTSRNSDKISS